MNHQNSHRENLQLDKEKSGKTGNFKIEFEWGPSHAISVMCIVFYLANHVVYSRTAIMTKHDNHDNPLHCNNFKQKKVV